MVTLVVEAGGGGRHELCTFPLSPGRSFPDIEEEGK